MTRPHRPSPTSPKDWYAYREPPPGRFIGDTPAQRAARSARAGKAAQQSRAFNKWMKAQEKYGGQA